MKHLPQQKCYENRYQLQEKQTIRNTNTWRLKTTFLNNQRVMKEIKTMPRYKWQ